MKQSKNILGSVNTQNSNERIKRKTVSPLTILSFVFFLGLFLFGINANEPQRVMEQAWNICLECIGIG